MNFNVLPNLVALSILVAVFWAISRKATTERLHLWLAGWILVLLHFAAQFVLPPAGPWERFILAISYDSLALAGAAFLISVSEIATTLQRQLLLAGAIGIPTVAFINGTVWDIASPAYYYGWIAAGVIAPLVLFGKFARRRLLWTIFVVLTTSAAAATMIWVVARGNSDLGLIVILTSLYFVVGVLYWDRYRRGTAGVLTSVIGFGLWGAVFPLGLLLELRAPSVKVESEVWNIPKYLVAVGMILTLLEDQIEKSKYLAYHDELTGLPNRRLLDDRLEQALAQANRNRSKVAVLQLDLDRFKEVNDTFGHPVGDAALQQIAARLATRIRACDTVARSGGDEFTVVSHVADAREAGILMSGLETVLSTPILVGGNQVRTGLSIGLALFPDQGSDPDQLHATADQAMYMAKRATRGAALTRPPRTNAVHGAYLPAEQESH